MPQPFRPIRLAALALLPALTSLTALPAWAFDTKARAAYVLDMGTGTVLLAKQADAPLPPASMSKLMTVYIAFEALRDGRLALDDRLPVSEHAMAYGGSTMFLNTRDRVRVEDLLRGIIVLSGNDACAVIAEALSPDGTEAGFARYMTGRARDLGMTNSTFANSNGWPAPGHVMSVHDLAILAQRLITDFPELYGMFSETDFAFDGRAPANTRNRNPILGLGIGADGLKTGHTNEAGYGLVGSAKQGDRRVIFVISGLDSTRARAEEAEIHRQLVLSQLLGPHHRQRRCPGHPGPGLDGTRTDGRIGAAGRYTGHPAGSDRQCAARRSGLFRARPGAGNQGPAAGRTGGAP